MKICSLLPSATEIAYALGLGEHLVAVTHECDYPPEAAQKPAITSSVLEHAHSDSGEIHRGITGLVHEGKSIYHLDHDLLEQLEPDLILTQELCDVCAVSYNIVREAARVLEGKPEIVSLEPNLLNDILANIRLVAEKTGTESQAQALLDAFEERINHVVTATAHITVRPRVYCMEWLDPPFAAGHWIPEMVSMAGGKEGLGVLGQPSEQVSWEAVVEFAPEVLILMPCGFDLQRTVDETPALGELPEWQDLPAVRNDRVYAVSGSAYFNRPGPRIIDGLEILAEIIHPELFHFSWPPDAWTKIDPRALTK